MIFACMKQFRRFSAEVRGLKRNNQVMKYFFRLVQPDPPDRQDLKAESYSSGFVRIRLFFKSKQGKEFMPVPFGAPRCASCIHVLCVK